MANISFATDSTGPDLLTHQFTWIDYTLFSLMFGVSAAVGVYFGFFKKQETAEEYILGGRTMKIFPIAMSLIASHLSGVTLLGVPSDIYYFGIQYWACALSAFLCSIIIIYVYLPVFYELNISSSYEYLEIRFDKNVRKVASLIYVISTVLHIPIIIYIPALALNQVSGLNVHHIAPVVCAICIFYTTIGGLKAVVWTDTLQFMVTIASMATVFGLGIYSAGGFANIWKIAEAGDRTKFNFDLDPTVRATFWSVSVGMTVMWVANLGVNPSSIQRFLAVPSLSAAKRSVVIFGSGVIITKSISCYSGLIMYAHYADCDPLKAGLIHRKDQLLPYYVLDVAGHIFGLPGLFISGVFSTALSTLSANLNTLAGTIYEDFILPALERRRQQVTQTQANNIMKGIVVVVGLFCFILIFVIEGLGGVLQISLSFYGMTCGPLLGLFTLGMLFKSANAKGALYGGITSLICMTGMLVGFQRSLMNKQLHHPMKPTSTRGCDSFSNITLVTEMPSNVPADSNVFWLFRISYYWFAVIGCCLVIIVGLIVSCITRDKSVVENVDISHLSPIIRWYYKRQIKRTMEAKEYIMVSKNEINEIHNSTDHDKTDCIINQ